MIRFRLYRLALHRTRLELVNVWRAKRGNDPFGMYGKDWSWPEAVRRTWRAHRDWVFSPERAEALRMRPR